MARTNRDEKLNIRIAEPLKAELESEAVAVDRKVSDIARRVLVDYAARRIVDRETDAA